MLYLLPVRTAILLLLCLGISLQSLARKSALESLIHSRIYQYGFTPDNLLKLASYFEMKGDYVWQHDQMKLAFGSLGSVSFYEDQCLIRLGSGKVYHLESGEHRADYMKHVNDALETLFERIPLMGNYGVEKDQIYFIDKHLADKNIEPFDKIYLRYMLVKYGKFDKTNEILEFRSEWLPKPDLKKVSKAGRELINRHNTPVMIHLYPTVVRGYYTKIGGTVYVDRTGFDGKYATGESASPNVAAFKLFIQKLFLQSINYISESENQRLESKVTIAHTGNVLQSSHLNHDGKSRIKPTNRLNGISSPYASEAWMIMMLSILRDHGTSIADPDILVYFKDEKYFPRLCEFMTEEEKRLVNHQLQMM